MRKVAVALLAGCSFGFVSIACAADIPARMPVKAAPVYPPPVAFTWTGFYLGANAGWGWSNGSGNMTFLGVPGSFSGSGNGFLGGVQAGYNYQIGSFVVGLETDFQGSAGSGTVNSVAGPIIGTGTAKTPWFGTIRGRLGYAMNDWLFYVTGGGLYGHSTFDGTVNLTGPFSASANYWTWTVGGGVEKMLWSRWSAKLEYLYADTPTAVPMPPGVGNVSGHADTHIVRVGLNYHF
jgi:outer membrane immunogenic protein